MKKNELVVRKSNDMIQNFATNLETTMEVDLFDYMIANIKSPMYDEEFHILEFDLMDFYKTTYGNDKLPGGMDYKYFKSTVERLAQRKTWGIVTEGKYKNYETIMRLIEKPYINPETGKVVLKLDDNLKPYLLDFANKPHTRFLYLTKAALSTSYTKRLYEILKSKENLAFGIWPPGTDYLSINSFKEMMFIPESYKAGNIKKRILNPAQIEIEEKTDISFSYREIKKGKGVIGYQFRIYKQEDKIDKAPPPPKKKNDEPKEDKKPEIEVKEYPSYIETLLDSIGSTGEAAEMLLAMIEEYLVILHDKPSEEQRTAYVYSLISKIRRARKINSTKLAYAEGIVRKELDKLKADKVSSEKQKPIREEKLPDWLKENQEEWNEKHNKEQDVEKQKELLRKAYEHYRKWGNKVGMEEKSLAYKEITGFTFEEEEISLLEDMYKLQKEFNQKENMEETNRNYQELTGEDIEEAILRKMVKLIEFCKTTENDKDLEDAKKEYKIFTGVDYD